MPPMTLPKGLEIWTAQTLCGIGILLSIVSFMMHLGRPYFERIQGRITLRVGADLWWIFYVLLRDGTLLGALLIGFLNLNLDLMADIKIGLPFVPLGTVVIAAALAVKVFSNTEDIGSPGFRAAFWLVTLGALLNTVGYVLVMECPGDEYTTLGGPALARFAQWRSNKNPELSTITYYITFPMLAAVVIGATLKGLALFNKAGRKGSSNVSD